MFQMSGRTAVEGTARVHAARRAPSLALLTSPAEDPVERFRQASDDHNHVSIGACCLAVPAVLSPLTCHLVCV